MVLWTTDQKTCSNYVNDNTVDEKEQDDGHYINNNKKNDVC